MKYIHLLFRLIISIPLWALCGAVMAVLYVAGWLVVPVAAFARAWKPAQSIRDGRDIQVWSWPFMWLWSNDEDGVLAGRQYLKTELSDPLQAIYWTAFRNPVNNHRYVRGINCTIKPGRVKFIGSFTEKLWSHPWQLVDHSKIVDKSSPHFDLIQSLWDKKTHNYDTKVAHWFFAWVYLQSNFYIQFNAFGKLIRFWIGWKIYPTDIFGLAPTNYRAKGAGFTFQLKRVRLDALPYKAAHKP